MEPSEYKNLLADIKDGTCAVVLGPEFFLLESRQEDLIESSRDIIYNDLLKQDKFRSEDGFLYTSDENKASEKKRILRGVQNYFSGLEVPTYYDLLAELPFNLFISLSPDDLMSRAMTCRNRVHDFVMYKKGNGVVQLEKKAGVEKWVATDMAEFNIIPTPDRPLIFNFQGIHDDIDSLIFTYDSLLDFFFSIFDEKKLPSNLTA